MANHYFIKIKYVYDNKETESELLCFGRLKLSSIRTIFGLEGAIRLFKGGGAWRLNEKPTGLACSDEASSEQ